MDEVDQWYGSVYVRVTQRTAPLVGLGGAIPGRVEYRDWLAVAPQFHGDIFDTADFFCEIEEEVQLLRNPPPEDV